MLFDFSAPLKFYDLPQEGLRNTQRRFSANKLFAGANIA